jgi:hypothetical protein
MLLRRARRQPLRPPRQHRPRRSARACRDQRCAGSRTRCVARWRASGCQRNRCASVRSTVVAASVAPLTAPHHLRRPLDRKPSHRKPSHRNRRPPGAHRKPPHRKLALRPHLLPRRKRRPRTLLPLHLPSAPWEDMPPAADGGGCSGSAGCVAACSHRGTSRRHRKPAKPPVAEEDDLPPWVTEFSDDSAMPAQGVAPLRR